ncbi:hypothetical protein FQA39_LY03894 [Lamprigera yunnana]|nr:hypothetical protein FQA39_LY03894 [Lamprigera yunnana]
MQKASVDKDNELKDLKKDKDLFNMETEILKKSLEDATILANKYKAQLTEEEGGKRIPQTKIEKLTNKVVNVGNQVQKLQTENVDLIHQIIGKGLNECKEVLAGSIQELDNPALSGVTCSTDYFKTLIPDCLDVLNTSIGVGHDNPALVVIAGIKLAHHISTFLLQGHATSNTRDSVMDVLENLCSNKPNDFSVGDATKKLKAVASLAETISGSLRGENADKLADMIDDELSAMDKAIEEAAKRI